MHLGTSRSKLAKCAMKNRLLVSVPIITVGIVALMEVPSVNTITWTDTVINKRMQLLRLVRI